MQKKCEYCGTSFDDTLEKCPTCGAPNDHIARSSNEQPTTIDELKQWYISHHLPPEEVTRFFIGKNVNEKRAFGIYKDENTGNFVVYKNKDNGQRAVRYDGKDEKYAVNELYQKLRDEISNQKNASKNRPVNKAPLKKEENFFVSLIKLILKFGLGLVIFCILFVACSLIFDYVDHDGYYSYNGTQYYNYNDTWYYYDDTYDDWYYAQDLDKNFTDNFRDYYEGYSYKDDYGSDFKDSDYYSSSSSSYTDDDDWGSDWDNDSSWSSSDSWDSGGSDWDSDW